MNEVIKLEIPVGNKVVARAFGRALLEIAGESESEATPRAVGMAPELGVPYGGTPDEEAAEPEETHTTPSPSSEVDEHGVTKDGKFCATAKVPFYTSGKRSGQWKKRTGVNDDEYDAWYAAQLDAVVLHDAHAEQGDGVDEDVPPVNTAAAFGKPAEEVPAVSNAPTEFGDLMVFVSNATQAGSITQADLQEAYTIAKLEVADLFTGDKPTIAGRVATLHAILQSKIAAKSA